MNPCVQRTYPFVRNAHTSEGSLTVDIDETEIEDSLEYTSIKFYGNIHIESLSKNCHPPLLF